MNRPIREIASGLLLAVGLLSAPPAAMAGLNSEELRLRSKEVEEMTAIERAALQRNWRLFQSLPPDRKQRYRQLHQQLEIDQKSGGNQLYPTMQTYAAWLHTLTPGQRADLRQAGDPQAKLALVRKFKADQDYRNNTRALNEPAENFSRRRWKMLQRPAAPLTSKELNALMDALSDVLPASDRDEMKRLDAQRDKWTRYRRIVLASANQAGGPQDWPDRDQQAAILAAISKSEPALRLKNIPDDQQRRMRWGQVIFSSLAEEILNEQAPFQPKEEDLEHRFEQLDHTEREALMRLPREQMKRELMRKNYMERMGNEGEFRKFVEVEREFWNFTWQFMGKAGFFIGRGPNGPGMDRPPFPPRGGRPREGRDGQMNGDRNPGDTGRRPPPRSENRRPPDRPENE